jgi:hypothetical protein
MGRSTPAGNRAGRIENCNHPEYGHFPPQPEELGHAPALHGMAGVDDPWWAAKVENCRLSFLEPQWGHTTFALLLATSSSNAFEQLSQTYS